VSAIGHLCNQYLGAGRNDPQIAGGVQYIMANLPDLRNRAGHNVYYWYYASQALHNLADKDWEKWNQAVKAILLDSQAREGCAAGSWDPDKPIHDAYGGAGRIMLTSLSCLNLEVYYRSLPTYWRDSLAAANGKAAAPPVKAASEPKLKFTKWVYKPDPRGESVSGYFQQVAGGWEEFQEGRLYSRYQQTDATNDYIELLDTRRHIWVRITTTQASWSRNSKDWIVAHYGAPAGEP
jgi:hypothetical protein